MVAGHHWYCAEGQTANGCDERTLRSMTGTAAGVARSETGEGLPVCSFLAPTRSDSAAAKEGVFANQHPKEGVFRSSDRFPSRAGGREPGHAADREPGHAADREPGHASDREPGHAGPASGRPQPDFTDTDSPNPMNPMNPRIPAEVSAPSAQQKPLKHTDEGIRQLPENREENYREE